MNDTNTPRNADLNDAPRLRGLVHAVLADQLIDWPTAKEYHRQISAAIVVGTLDQTGRRIRAELRAVK